jgi:hypothetical protein
MTLIAKALRPDDANAPIVLYVATEGVVGMNNCIRQLQVPAVK